MQRSVFQIAITDKLCFIHRQRRTQQKHPPSTATSFSRNEPKDNHTAIFNPFYTTASASSVSQQRRCRFTSLCEYDRKVGARVVRYVNNWKISSRVRHQHFSIKSWPIQQQNQLLGVYRSFSSNSDTNTSDVIEAHVEPPSLHRSSQLGIENKSSSPYHPDNGATPIESKETTTNAPRSSAFFDGILSKIDSSATTGAGPSSHAQKTVTSVAKIIDWDKDVFGAITSQEERATNATATSGEGDDDNLKLQERIKEVNEIRQRDILKRQSKVLRKCHKNRKKQYIIYSSTEKAIEAAKTYAQETNHSTLKEIQSWTPYTEQDVKDLFLETYTQRALFNMKDMKQIMAKYDHAIYNTSLLVLPSTTSKTEAGKALPAITNYPKSSLQLLTLLKGMHNSINAVTNPIESLFVKFMLHRPSYQEKENYAMGSGLNDTTYKTDAVNPGLSSFDDFMELQKDEKIEWNGAIVNDHADTELNEEQYVRETVSSATASSMMTPSEPNYNKYYHQSYDEYRRMVNVLERLRETLYTSNEDKRRKQPKPDYVKNPEKTTRMASHLAYYLPNILFINLITFLNELDSTIVIKKKADGKASRIRSIQHTKMSSVVDKFYFHFIASQLSDYLFHHDDDIKTKESINGSDVATPTTSASATNLAIYNYQSKQPSKIQLYKGYASSLDYHTSVQSAFVALFMDVQDILYKDSRVIVLDQDDETCKKLRKSIMADSISVHNEEFLNDSNNDTIDPDAIDSKVPIVTDGDDEKLVNANYKKMSSKITNQMVESVDESTIRPVGFRKRKIEKEILPVSHLAFEAISLELNAQSNDVMNVPTVSGKTSHESLFSSSINDVEQTNLNGHSSHSLNGSDISPAKYNLLSSNCSSPYARMVFIDNLPIDISPERINEVYSRCGEIESVEIFNQRPDLDPGKLAKVEIVKRRAKQTKMSLSARTWSRPKTPVYGLLTFANETGYEKAIDESLRIFGMIIQRHPVRSIPSWCMNTLYIEDVPAGHPCIDLEYQLSYALEPNNIFVCLNAGQNYTSTVGSCEIKFPTFEIAYESYKNLQEKLSIFESSSIDTIASKSQVQEKESAVVFDKTCETALTTDKQCRINWIASQKDAHKWWTRQYGFD